MIDEAAVEFEKVARANHAMSHLVEAEAALAKLQARDNVHATTAIELQQAKEKLARSRQLVEKGLMAPRDLTELEAQLANLEKRLLATHVTREARMRDVEAATQAHATDARRLHELLTDRTAAAEARQQSNAAREQERAAMADRLLRDVDAQELAATEPARAGDTLRITIEGEPDLPSSYRVRDDGTIRLPFVGVLKVSGLTAAQVRDALGKQLSDRKLGSVNQVRVTLARPRVRESRSIKVDVTPGKGKDPAPVEIRRVR